MSRILKMKKTELLRILDGVHKFYKPTGECRIGYFNSREFKIINTKDNGVCTIIDYVDIYGNRIDCPLKIIDGWKWKD